MNEIATLQNNVDTLKSNVNLLKSELEDKNQLIYDYKKQLTLALALEKDYQQEIETLQSSESTEAKGSKEKIVELEANVVKLKDYFNTELLQRTEIIDNLKDQINEFSKIRKNNKNDNSDDHQYAVERNLGLKEEKSNLTRKLTELESNINYLQIQNVSLEQSYNILYNELKDKNQYFASKSQELTSAKNKLQILQEDIFLTKLELESMKSKPLDTCSKGNSLFAEVEDSCQKIQQNLDQTKKNYSRLKQDVTTKMKQLSTMRNQNIELSTKLNMVNGLNEDYDKIIEKYKTKMHAWESAIEEYKKQTFKQPKFHGNDLPQYAVDFANNTLRTKWASEKKLLESLNNESKRKLETYTEIETVNNEMRRWRRIAQQLKVKTEKLENFISEIELYNNLGTTDDLEECFKRIEQELLHIDSNINITLDDILKCGGSIEQNAPSMEADVLTDTLYDELLGLSSVVVKSDNSLENLQDMESNLTNTTEIENTFAEKLTIKNDVTYNSLLVKDEIKNESIDVSAYQIKVKSEIDEQEDNVPNKLEDVMPEKVLALNDYEAGQNLESNIPEIDNSIQNVSIIEIESTFNESNTTEEEHSLGIIKIENESIIEDSSVEIIGEFKIIQEENIKPTQYDYNALAVKVENSEDNNSVDFVSEYNDVQNENSLIKAELIQSDKNNSTQAEQENNTNVDIAVELIHLGNEYLIDDVELKNKDNPLLQEKESNNIQTEIKLSNLQKQNLLDNVQTKQSTRSYSTPAAKSTSSVKSGSESKTNSNCIHPYNSLQKQNSLSSFKTKQYKPAVQSKCATAVKSIPNAVPTKKYVSQSEKKVLTSTTTSIPIPARKKLL